MQRLGSRPTDFSGFSDAELVRLALQRDGDAFRAIMQRHNRRLYRVARSVMHNDSEAEDVVQEAYVLAFTNLANFRAESSLATWLTRITLNEAMGRLRRRRPTVDLSTLDLPTGDGAQVIPFPTMISSEDPERNAAQREIRGLIERAVDELPEIFRVVFVMRDVEDMSIEETAAFLSLRPETVKTRLHRARKLLRQALDEKLAPVLTDVFPFAGTRQLHGRGSQPPRTVAASGRRMTVGTTTHAVPWLWLFPTSKGEIRPPLFPNETAGRCGGAIVALQALHLRGGDDGSLIGAQPLRRRSPWGQGR